MSGAFFTVPRAEISTPERLAHLPSMVRANERGPFFSVFTVPRAEMSSPQRPAHLLSMRANDSLSTVPLGRNHLPSPVMANERGVPRAEISTAERPAHLPPPVRANERGPFVPFLNERGAFVSFFTVPRAEISTAERPSHLLLNGEGK